MFQKSSPKLKKPVPAELVRARLGEDLDAAVAELVVLGRERILVDADLADRLFRRKLAAAESVDEDGAAVGAGRRPGQRLQVGGQIVGIVGERVQIGAAQHQRAGVVRRVDGDARRGVVLHGDLLLGGRDFQLEVQRPDAGLQGDCHRLE